MSDDQQFHLNQQDEQSPLIFTQCTQKKTMTYDEEVLAWDRHKNVAG